MPGNVLPPSVEFEQPFNPACDTVTMSMIRRRVKKHMRVSKCGLGDHTDLMQELLARVVQRLPSFDAQVGHIYPFVATVIDREMSKLIRDGKAVKRQCGPVESLNINVGAEDEEAIEFSQVIGEREMDRRTGHQSNLSHEQLANLRIDLERVMRGFPDHWRRLLDHCKTHNLAEVAQLMGIPRTTLADWMSQIRERFEEAGLADYFQT